MSVGSDRHNAPILVTGGHRSGTTFVGKMLAASSEVVYIHEPFNPASVSVGSPVPPFERAYQYVCAENANAFASPISDIVDLRFHLGRRLLMVHGPTEYCRAVRAQAGFVRARLGGKRPLLKDPIALFSAQWLHDAFGAHVVVMIRHPAGFVSSLARLGWNFNFRHWLEQELLMRDYLAPIADEVAAQVKSRGDIIEQGIVLWKGIHLGIDRMRDRNPDWMFVRHEDLSLAPLDWFQRLYACCRLRWTAQARRRIAVATSNDNPVERSVRDSHSIKRNSAATVRLWETRLTASDVKRVIEGTRDVAQRFYAGEELEPSIIRGVRR